MSSKIRPVLVPIMDVPKSEVKGEEITEVIVKYKNKYNNLYAIRAIIAFILSWLCNKEQPFYLKLLYGIIALILSYWYLLFYFIYYIYLNKNCSDEITIDNIFKNTNLTDLQKKLSLQSPQK